MCCMVTSETVYWTLSGLEHETARLPETGPISTSCYWWALARAHVKVLQVTREDTRVTGATLGTTERNIGCRPWQ